tara:strand:+ start:274 stop:516 length:243 start_codon:yes stop_codon:yes gene_type:complete
MKLTYWYAECLNDSDCYSIREKTKSAAIAEKASLYNPEGYGPVIKVTVEYDNAFDLMEKCSDEFSMHWEAQATLAINEEN